MSSPDRRSATRSDGPVRGVENHDETQRALAACMFSPPSLEHLWWTVLVADPALRDTPSHLRLIGHYASEFEALDAADHLAAELNCCLLPGEAPLSVTPLGIESGTPATQSTTVSRTGHTWISPV